MTSCECVIIDRLAYINDFQSDCKSKSFQYISAFVLSHLYHFSKSPVLSVLVFYWLSGRIWQHQLLTCLLRDSKILFCFLFLIVSSLLSQVDMSDFLDMVIRDYLNYSKFVCVILFLVPSLSSSISSSSFNCESRVFLFVVPGCIYTFLVSIFFRVFLSLKKSNICWNTLLRSLIS